MDLRHLELLRELAERGTLAAVATAGYRSPSAVSQQLRSAERAFGVALVEPDGRGLRLTAAGRLLADGAVEVALTLAELQRELDALQGEPAGTVTIASLPSAAQYLMPGLLARFTGSPIEVVLTDSDVAEADFAAHAADHDLVIAHSMSRTPSAPEGIDLEVLGTEPLDVAVPSGHRLAALDQLTPADLAGIDWIGVPEGFPFDTLRIAIENQAGAPLRVVQRVRDNPVVAALVATGIGCALLPRFTTGTIPGLVTRPLSGVRAARSIVVLARPDRRARAAVQAVLAELRTIAAAQPSGATST